MWKFSAKRKNAPLSDLQNQSNSANPSKTNIIVIGRCWYVESVTSFLFLVLLPLLCLPLFHTCLEKAKKATHGFTQYLYFQYNDPYPLQKHYALAQRLQTNNGSVASTLHSVEACSKQKAIQCDFSLVACRSDHQI